MASICSAVFLATSANIWHTNSCTPTGKQEGATSLFVKSLFFLCFFLWRFLPLIQISIRPTGVCVKGQVKGGQDGCEHPTLSLLSGVEVHRQVYCLAAYMRIYVLLVKGLNAEDIHKQVGIHFHLLLYPTPDTLAGDVDTLIHTFPLSPALGILELVVSGVSPHAGTVLHVLLLS